MSSSRLYMCSYPLCAAAATTNASLAPFASSSSGLASLRSLCCFRVCSLDFMVISKSAVNRIYCAMGRQDLHLYRADARRCECEFSSCMETAVLAGNSENARSFASY